MIEVRTAANRQTLTHVLLLLLLAFVLGFPGAGQSQALPYRPGFGSELVYECKAYLRTTSGPYSAHDAADGGNCVGYLDGFVDGTNSEFEALTPPNPGKDYWATRALCIPPSTLDTRIKVYLAFMERNPKYLDEDKATSLRTALHDAYPCQK